MTSTDTLTDAPVPAAPASDEVRDDSYFLHRAPVGRALVHLAVPMMAATTVGVVYNVVNAGFIGALHSTALLAALTFGLPLTALIMAIAGVFGTGGSSAIARLLGELQTDPDEASAAALRTRVRRLSAFTVWGAVLAGVVLAVVGLVLLDPITHLLGATGDAFAPTAAYVGVLLGGAPVLVLAFAIEQLVRAEGATRASMTGIILSTAGNLVLDVVFIVALGWGVAGAALAIVGSNVIAVAYFVRYLHRHSPELTMSPRWFRPDRATAVEVFGVGVSELLMMGFLTVTSIVFNRVAAGYGEGALAAFGLAQRIVQVPEMLAMGVTLGAMPLLATAFGARAMARLRAGVTISAGWIAAIVAVFALPTLLLRERLLTLFSADPSVLSTGLLVLAAMLVSTLFNGFTGLATTTFQATGQAGPANLMATAQGLLFVPVLLVGNALFGLVGVIWALPVTEVLCFGLAAVLVVLRRRTFTAAA